MDILILIVGMIAGGLIVASYLNPKVKTSQIIDQQTIDKNLHLQEENDTLKKELQKLEHEYVALIAKKEEVLSNITTLQKQAEESANSLYEKSYELANEKMSQAADNMSNKYREMEKNAKEEYELILKDCADNFLKQINSKQEELDKINKELIDLTSKMDAAVEASKRAEQQSVKQDFYRLQLPKVDIEEIKRLRSVSIYLRDSEPLNKVIWKVYYEKPYTDLIGRVVGTGIHTGIYKITNIENQMCYVGQAVNIADRWKQHIKRGIGAEAPTRNKLYPVMLEKGVENFTFEIVEEVERSKLNEREDYWQEYFHAKDFGYSIK